MLYGQLCGCNSACAHNVRASSERISTLAHDAQRMSYSRYSFDKFNNGFASLQQAWLRRSLFLRNVFGTRVPEMSRKWSPPWPQVHFIESTVCVRTQPNAACTGTDQGDDASYYNADKKN